MDLNSFSSSLKAAIESDGSLTLKSDLLSPQTREFLTIILLDANIFFRETSVSFNDTEVIVNGEVDLFGDGPGFLTAKFTITTGNALQIQIDTNPPVISLQTLALNYYRPLFILMMNIPTLR